MSAAVVPRLPARRAGLLLLAAAVAGPSVARAQGTPAGTEFRVNSYTTNDQRYPVVAAGSAGNFVVVWESDSQDGSSSGVFGRRYTSGGASLGAEFRVNTHTTDFQERPAVASDPSGNFVVVWASSGQDGDATGTFGQRYTSAGARLGAEFQVNTYTTSFQEFPAVCRDPLGGFVVVWQGYLQDGSHDGVFGQRFASSGARLGAEFQVNTYTTGTQGGPVLASDSAGNFVVAWVSYQDGGRFGVFAQRYASGGARLGAEFRVNAYTSNDQLEPHVTRSPAGDFVVVWTSYQQDGSLNGIFGRRYASGGAPLGSEFRVNTVTTHRQVSGAIASDSSGNFVVAWGSYNQDGSQFGVFGQLFASDGARLGGEFQISTYTTGDQLHAGVSTDAAGAFVVVWDSFGQDGSFAGSFGQRFTHIDPALSFFTLPPCRAVDTRNAAGPFGGPALQPSTTRDIDLALAGCGVPGTARAVSLNVAVTQPAQSGFLTIWPQGATRPLASTINFGAGQTRTNNAVIPVAPNRNGTVGVFSGTGGTVHLILDVNGYFQ